jgi:hypothetical protein
MVLAIASETTLSERVCDGDEVSCEVQGTMPLHGSFYRAFKEACASLRYSDKLNLHSLRHTTATRLAVKVKPDQVQDFMGHGSAGGIPAHGSYLGCMTAKRLSCEADAYISIRARFLANVILSTDDVAKQEERCRKAVCSAGVSTS